MAGGLSGDPGDHECGGIAPMKEGKIFLEGTDAGKMTRKELAEKLGYCRCHASLDVFYSFL